MLQCSIIPGGDCDGLLARLEALAPEVVLINVENPSRDLLEEYFAVSRALARPIAICLPDVAFD